MKGETPVPGPIMMIGVLGSSGRWNGLRTRGKIGTYSVKIENKVLFQ